MMIPGGGVGGIGGGNILSASVGAAASTSTLVFPSYFHSAIQTIRWPLGSEEPPLHYEPLATMKDIRRRNRGTPPALIESNSLFDDVVGTLETLFPSKTTTTMSADDRHWYGYISAALILVGNGYTDEAHDIITPLSWPDETHFGYSSGSSNVYQQLSDSVKTYSSCVHSYIHRKEGYNMGEYNMIGWQNANYWTHTSMNIGTDALNELPHDDWFQYIRSFLKEYTSSTSEERSATTNSCDATTNLILNWAKQNHFIDFDNSNDYYYEPRAVHELCAMATKKTSSTIQLQQFAEQVAELELRVLLGHTLYRAGFCTVSNDTSSDSDKIMSMDELVRWIVTTR